MLDPHCMTSSQRTFSSFGRAMMAMAATEKNDMISNALARVGEHLAERSSMKGLTTLDKQVINYAKTRMASK